MVGSPSKRPMKPSEVAPAPGTVESWCRNFVLATDLAAKLAPPPLPDLAAPENWESSPPPRRLPGPGRPPELELATRSPRTPGRAALARPEVRARLVHTFLHHELQAAELFAWAVLAFPDTPRAFRTGLLALCREELAHLALYAEHLEHLDFAVGAFPVRDWFWQRVARCASPVEFVALQGLGLEGANLEHSARFATWFRDAGDERGALILERVEREEIAHVAFAVHWFEQLTGQPLDYDRWRAALPAPLTPAVLQGRPLNRDARRRAGLDDAFLARLEAEPPTSARRTE